MEKLIECVPTLEVIEQRLDGHSGANKNRGPSKDVRVAVNDGGLSRHDSQYTLNARGVPNGMRLVGMKRQLDLHGNVVASFCPTT
jgi:hypothetical protein